MACPSKPGNRANAANDALCCGYAGKPPNAFPHEGISHPSRRACTDNKEDMSTKKSRLLHGVPCGAFLHPKR
jgi:hypothetical protein